MAFTFKNKRADGAAVRKELYALMDGMMGSKGHVEAGRSGEALYEYVQKPESRVAGPEEWMVEGADLSEDQAKRSGKGGGFRSDLETFNKDVKAGVAAEVLQDKHMVIECKYTKYFDRVVGRNPPPRSLVGPKVVVITGKPGTGKTRAVMMVCEEAKTSPFRVSYPKGSQVEWFRNWNTTDPLLFDEYSKDAQMRAETLLGVSDVHKFTVRTSNEADSVCRHKAMFMTSMSAYANWYEKNPNFGAAFSRRVGEEYYVDYNPNHQLDPKLSNEENVACADNAIWTVVKGKGVFVAAVKALFPNIRVVDNEGKRFHVVPKALEWFNESGAAAPAVLPVVPPPAMAARMVEAHPAAAAVEWEGDDEELAAAGAKASQERAAAAAVVPAPKPVYGPKASERAKKREVVVVSDDDEEEAKTQVVRTQSQGLKRKRTQVKVEPANSESDE